MIAPEPNDLRREARRAADAEYDATCDAARRVCADAVKAAGDRRTAAYLAANEAYYAALEAAAGGVR